MTLNNCREIAPKVLEVGARPFLDGEMGKPARMIDRR